MAKISSLLLDQKIMNPPMPIMQLHSVFGVDFITEVDRDSRFEK